MPISLSDVVDDLFKRQKQDAGRLDMLARYCIEAFEREGLGGVRGGKADEVGIRGLGHQKDWDLAYVLAGKPRLLISLKSILKNLRGTIPNHLDDLMGEAANVQQLSPEIVIGYVVIVDEHEDSLRHDGSGTWIDHFESNLQNCDPKSASLESRFDRSRMAYSHKQQPARRTAHICCIGPRCTGNNILSSSA
jgi:hypothetical protein